METPSSSRSPLTLTRGAVIGTVLIVVIAATCIRLGFWQLDRLEQRRARNSALEERLALAPLAVTGPLADTTGMSFRRARAAGAFDHDRTIVLPGRSLMGAPGVHVLTPLRFASSGAAVLVNRGWVPAADAATIDYSAVRTATDTVVEGILLPFPGRGASLAPAGSVDGDSAFRRVWYALDEEVLRRQFPYELVDVQIQLLPREGERAVMPRPRPPPRLDEGPHRGYAIQWFSFAAIAIIGWIALLSKDRRNRREHQSD